MKIDPSKDGIDHINIYSQGKTELGRLLSNWHDTYFTTSIGHFRTIEGLIFYLSSFDDQLRTCSGKEAKTLGPKLDREFRLPKDIFKKLIIEAMEAKTLRYDVETLLRESELPFKHYYVFGDKIIKPSGWDWQIKEWDKIRTKLKSLDWGNDE